MSLVKEELRKSGPNCYVSLDTKPMRYHTCYKQTSITKENCSDYFKIGHLINKELTLPKIKKMRKKNKDEDIDDFMRRMTSSPLLRKERKRKRKEEEEKEEEEVRRSKKRKKEEPAPNSFDPSILDFDPLNPSILNFLNKDFDEWLKKITPPNT